MGKDYHKECTGEAAKTAHRHAKSGSEITLFGECAELDRVASD